ncbi:MAG: Smr/MutS family protein [Pseudomonadota bacterium]
MAPDNLAVNDASMKRRQQKSAAAPHQATLSFRLSKADRETWNRVAKTVDHVHCQQVQAAHISADPTATLAEFRQLLEPAQALRASTAPLATQATRLSRAMTTPDTTEIDFAQALDEVPQQAAVLAPEPSQPAAARQWPTPAAGKSSPYRRQPIPARVTDQIAPPDTSELRKIRSGRLAIDARIDLHGMRQHEAHAALRSFLLSAHARGARWTLVITGKGGNYRRTTDDGAEDFGQRGTAGVLRQRVPEWLSSAELRRVIVGFDQAGPKHGGAGALYVRLRKAR